MNEHTRGGSWTRGLKITDGSNRGSVNITADSVMIDGFTFKNVSVSCDLGANLGAGGLDFGSEAANVWYGIYLICDSAGSKIRAMFSGSFSQPNFNNAIEYTHYLRIGARLNNASLDLYRVFPNSGGWHIYNEVCTASPFVLVLGGAATTWQTVSVPSVPPGCNLGLFTGYLYNNNVAGPLKAWIRPTGSNLSNNDNAAIVLGYAQSAVAWDMHNRGIFAISANRQIDWQVYAATNSFTLACIGYYDSASA